MTRPPLVVILHLIELCIHFNSAVFNQKQQISIIGSDDPSFLKKVFTAHPNKVADSNNNNAIKLFLNKKLNLIFEIRKIKIIL
jgi:hypothetical protein